MTHSIEELQREIEEWHSAALYDPSISGIPRFKSWNRSQLDRCRKEFIERRFELANTTHVTGNNV